MRSRSIGFLRKYSIVRRLEEYENIKKQLLSSTWSLFIIVA